MPSDTPRSAHDSAPGRPLPADATARTAPAIGAGVRGAAAPQRDSRALVRALVERERLTGVRLTGVQVATQVGLKPRRAQELLRDLRAELDTLQRSERDAQRSPSAPATPLDHQAASLPSGERLALAAPNTTPNTPPTAEGGALTCITIATSLHGAARPRPRPTRGRRPPPTRSSTAPQQGSCSTPARP